MKCLVTGGAGFIGTNLIIRLLQDGHDVISFDNYSTGFKDNEQEECRYIDVDISNEFSWDSRFDVIFHLAALPRIGPSFKNPNSSVKVNVGGTCNVLDYARKRNIPVVYAGTSSVHGGVYKNPYTFTKWQGEELCKMYSRLYDVPTIICRFYNVYGDHMPYTGEYRTVIPIFLEQKAYNKPLTITGDGEQRRDFTHVEDIVDALVKSMEAMNGAVDMRYEGLELELGRGENYSINEVADMFGQNKVYVDSIPGEVRETLCKSKEARELLDWKPKINLKQWIEEII